MKPVELDFAGVERDAKVAEARGLLFQICWKKRPRASWESIREGIPDLREAMEEAIGYDEFEVGVFTDGPGRNRGMIYWTSDSPVLNSTVVSVEAT